jgi:hypothetical protein
MLIYAEHSNKCQTESDNIGGRSRCKERMKQKAREIKKQKERDN